MPREQRYDTPLNIDIKFAARTLVFVGENELSSQVARQLTRAFSTLQQAIRQKPFVQAEFNRFVLDNRDNLRGDLTLRASSMLPCEASREVDVDPIPRAGTVVVVLRDATVRAVMGNLAAAGSGLSDREHLGLCWPLTRALTRHLFDAPQQEHTKQYIRGEFS